MGRRGRVIAQTARLAEPKRPTLLLGQQQDAPSSANAIVRTPQRLAPTRRAVRRQLDRELGDSVASKGVVRAGHAPHGRRVAGGHELSERLYPVS